jgi:hypothetical protein
MVVCVTIENVREGIQIDDLLDNESVVVDEKGAIVCEAKETCDGIVQDVDDDNRKSDHTDALIETVVEGIKKFCESLDDVDNREWEISNENLDNGGRERVQGDLKIVKVVKGAQKNSMLLENLDDRQQESMIESNEDQTSNGRSQTINSVELSLIDLWKSFVWFRYDRPQVFQRPWRCVRRNHRQSRLELWDPKIHRYRIRCAQGRIYVVKSMTIESIVAIVFVQRIYELLHHLHSPPIGRPSDYPSCRDSLKLCVYHV